MDCPHLTSLSEAMINEIKWSHLKKNNCPACSDPNELLFCLGCFKNFCLDHPHECCPLFYYPSQNILFCSSCKKQITSLDLNKEQNECYDSLKRKFESLRNYNFNCEPVVSRFYDRIQLYDKNEQVSLEQEEFFVKVGETEEDLQRRKELLLQKQDVIDKLAGLQSKRDEILSQLSELQGEGFYKPSGSGVPKGLPLFGDNGAEGCSPLQDVRLADYNADLASWEEQEQNAPQAQPPSGLPSLEGPIGRAGGGQDGSAVFDEPADFPDIGASDQPALEERFDGGAEAPAEEAPQDALPELPDDVPDEDLPSDLPAE